MIAFEKIDAGLGRCTHFVALLTPHSIGKAWVRAEMDARAFVKRLEGECRFIPLLHDLPVEKLPPLLRGIRSLRLDDFNADLRTLVEEIGEVNRQPSPESAGAWCCSSDHSDGAFAGRCSDCQGHRSKLAKRYGVRPTILPDDVKQGTGLSDKSIKEAVDELIERGVVENSGEIRERPLGFLLLFPRDHLFGLYDGFFMDWNPAEDALQIASDLVTEESGSTSRSARRSSASAMRGSPAG